MGIQLHQAFFKVKTGLFIDRPVFLGSKVLNVILWISG